MSIINALTNDQAAPEAQATLAAVQASLGVTPNLFRVAANSPAALNGLVQLNGALAKSHLRLNVRESVALAVAQINGCDYCLSIHSALAANARLGEDAIASARRAEALDPHTQAVLALAAAITRERGQIGTAAIDRAKAAGVTDAEIVETVALVALNVFTNYLNNVAGTEIDFPIVHAAESIAV